MAETANLLDRLPTSDDIRERLARNIEERSALRQLLRLALKSENSRGFKGRDSKPEGATA
jgi:hypothetical protein